jgi:sulfonate transport system substrate-binding protein
MSWLTWMIRSWWMAVLLAGTVVVVFGCSRGASPSKEQSAATLSPKSTLRVVKAKQLIPLHVLEKNGTLEKRLSPLGVGVEWLEFAAGPQELEALNAGALDIALTAESPVVFSQAAGAPVVYLATTANNGKSISLLVGVNSSIKTVADLKGRKIAVQKASIGHYLLVKALERAGVALTDIEWVFMPPPDANVAFSEGKVDGWFIWEPFVTRAEQAKVGRVLTDGEQLRDTGNFYTTSRAFADAHPEVLKIFLEELQKVELWSKAHPKEMCELLASSLFIDVPTLEIMHGKYEFGVRPVTEASIVKQQEVADMWQKLGFLPAKVDVRTGFLPADRYAAIVPEAVATVR